MIKFIDVTGKTEDEAISRALAQLGLDRDDVSVEILERAKSGFLGLGACPAKVRVTYGEKEDILADLKPLSAVKEEPVRESKPVKAQQPKAEKKPERKPREKTEPKVKAEPKSEPKPKAEGKPAPAPVDNGEEIRDEKSDAIRAFLSGLLAEYPDPRGVEAMDYYISNYVTTTYH